nr:ABC transporter ATP-binding protein [Pseudomonas sp.]
MSTEANALELRNLSVSYGNVPVVHGISLVVPKGRVVTIIGANGAGKSTIMKTVCGLLRPASGEILLFGEPITGMEADRLVPKGLSLVPEGRRLFGVMTVRENLEMGAYCRDKSTDMAADLERTLSFFPDLKTRLSAQAGTLSGGQQQMVAVARALMSAPRLLLLDEPTIGLAPAIVDVIAQVISDIRDSGVDVLLVEQNAETALEISDFGYVLEGGNVVLSAPSSELARNAEVQRAYLGL